MKVSGEKHGREKNVLDYLTVLFEFFFFFGGLYFVVFGLLTVLKAHTKSLRIVRLLGLLHDIDAPRGLVVN